MNGIDFLQRITKESEKVAMTVDKSIREAAYNRAFDFFLKQGDFGNTPTSKRGTQSSSSKTSERESSSKDEVETLMHIDRNAYKEVLNAPSVLDRSLHLLRIANNEYQIDGLKASQIAKVLTDNFRLGTTRQAVAQALDNAGDKINSVSVGKGTVYRIMARGESYLDNESKQESEQVTHSPSSRTNGKSARTTAKPKAEKTTAPTSSQKRKGRPGPKAILTDLITAGFFKSPKIINDIQTQLENTQGYRYKTTELAPALVRLLREKLINREKNSEGQYEYKSR